MTVKHYDSFNGSGLISSKPYWSVASMSGGAPATWTMVNSAAELSGSSSDAVAIHGTDGGLALPADHNVMMNFSTGQGISELGLTTMGGSSFDLASQITLKWQEISSGTTIAQNMTLVVPGFSDQTVAVNNAAIINPSFTGLVHALALESSYQAMNNGKPEFIFRGYLNGNLVLTSAPRRLDYWDAAKFTVGMLASKDTGVPWPVTRILEFSSEVPTPDATHEPKPTLTTPVVRTPISISDEITDDSPATFPFDLRTVEVKHVRHTRGTLTAAGYEPSHPELSNARRVFKCRWIGSDADADTLEAFIDARGGIFDNFNVTIRALGIGTVSAAFITIGEFVSLTRGVKSIQFDLLELF